MWNSQRYPWNQYVITDQEYFLVFSLMLIDILLNTFEQIHLKTMLWSRFVSLCESMCKSSKLSIRLMDIYPTIVWFMQKWPKNKIYKNLSNIANKTYVDKLFLNKSLVKSIYANPAENSWRIPLLKDLLLIRLIRSN